MFIRECLSYRIITYVREGRKKGWAEGDIHREL